MKVLKKEFDMKIVIFIQLSIILSGMNPPGGLDVVESPGAIFGQILRK